MGEVRIHAPTRDVLDAIAYHVHWAHPEMTRADCEAVAGEAHVWQLDDGSYRANYMVPTTYVNVTLTATLIGGLEAVEEA